MFRSNSLRRGAAALVLLSSFALAHPAPAAAEPATPVRQPVVRPHHPSFLGSLWHLLTSLAGHEGGVTDPNGQPKP